MGVLTEIEILDGMARLYTVRAETVAPHISRTVSLRSRILIARLTRSCLV